MRNSHLALLIPLLLLTAGQLSAALSGRAIAAGASSVNWYTAGTYFFFILRGVSWILIIRHVRLSFAYPVMSLGYCLVPPAAVLVLGEHLDWRTLAGMVLISAGVAVIGSGEKESAG
jgi:drug/metabolite transporter (DMT)-like permease